MWVVGDELLLFALLVPVDEQRCGVKNRLGTAIVLLKRDDLRSGEVAFKIKNVADVRATPFINGLVRIADDTEVRVMDRQPSSYFVLSAVCILVFIDEDVFEPTIQICPKLLVVP